MQMQMQLQAIFFHSSFWFIVSVMKSICDGYYVISMHIRTHVCNVLMKTYKTELVSLCVGFFVCLSSVVQRSVDETLRLFDHLLCLSLSTKIVEHHFSAFVFGFILTTMKTNFSIQKAKIFGRQLSQLKRPALQ